MKPDDSTEVLWMVFSLLSLDPGRQVEILRGLPLRAEADERMLIENGATYLLGTIQTCYVSWLDEFEPCPIAQQLFDLAWSMRYMQSHEDFINEDDWNRLRILAKFTLQEAGLDPWPVPASVDFSDYIEIVSLEDPA